MMWLILSEAASCCPSALADILVNFRGSIHTPEAAEARVVNTGWLYQVLPKGRGYGYVSHLNFLASLTYFWNGKLEISNFVH